MSIQVIPNPKPEIKFWLDALENPNLDQESKNKLNTCLQIEINNYLQPFLKVSNPPSKEDWEKMSKAFNEK